MKVIRPIRPDDLEDFLEMAEASVGGISSLPPDSDLLRWKIERSQFAFSVNPLRPNGESYLFVLEDTEQQKAVGCCGLLSKAGGYKPLYTYRLKSEQFASDQLEVTSSVDYLDLQRIHDGPTEVCTLFLMPNYRQGGMGRLLSLSRFLFIAMHRKRFESRVTASFRGILTEDGDSPFWAQVCQPFFGIDFETANRLRYIDPRFVDDLIPPYPLYIPLLPKTVQEVIGKTHPHTVPAANILTQEGFAFSGDIDVFDGGPFYSADVANIRAIHDCKVVQLAATSDHIDGEKMLVCNDHLDFRGTLSTIKVEGDQATLPKETARALRLQVGDPLAFLTPYPETT